MEKPIKTIKELLEIVNAGNLDNFLKDFDSWLRFHVSLKGISYHGVEIEVNEDTFLWIDDGKNDITLKFEITQAPPPHGEQ